MNREIGAIIVVYNPDEADFFKVVSAILPQVDFLVLVNNGTTLPIRNSDLLTRSGRSLDIIDNNGNLGVATALNVGIRYLKDKSHYILFLDHDSLVEPDMVAKLVEAYDNLNRGHDDVVAVGPVFFNPLLEKDAPFVRFGWLRLQLLDKVDGEPYISTESLISSGTLITYDSIEKVGFMIDKLFIDCIDIEWSMRAVSKGYKLYGCHEARMHHPLGEDVIVFQGKKMASHSPLRHYYIIRNFLYMFLRTKMKLKWRSSVMMCMIAGLVIYTVATKNGIAHLKMMGLGLFHGLIGRYGRYKG